MLVYGSYIQVPKLGVTPFDSYSYDDVSAGIWVIHTKVANLGARWSCFLTVTLMMVLVLMMFACTSLN